MYVTAILSVVLAALPFALGMGSGPVIFVPSTLAVVLAVLSLRRAQPLPARVLAGLGVTIGAFTLLTAGWLWLAFNT